jgi:two-component system, OmpR family, sensor kinase
MTMTTPMTTPTTTPTTPTTETGTTEPPYATGPTGLRRLLHPDHWTVRTRITVTVALLGAMSLGGAGGLVYLLGVEQAQEEARVEVRQEMDELENFQSLGIDPRTGRLPDDYRRLVRLFLQRNVPSPDELMVGAWNGSIRARSVSSRADVLDDPAVEAAILDRIESGGSTTVPTQYGDVFIDVARLRTGSDRGAFVILYFVQDRIDQLQATMRTYALAAGVALVLVTAVSAWLAGRLLSPVRTLRETAQDISETDLSRRIPVVSKDDLGDLSRTFNAMLDRLDQAFRGQRAFLDDAGHELRTPLTVLHGHLELMDPHDEDDVRRTRVLLIEETERMSRLVEDMILLTKADRPGFVVPGEVNLDELTDRVADKMRGLADRQWTIDARAAVVAEVDEQRLTQALLQLAQNAVRHTHAGDVVAVGSAASSNGTVSLWVRDAGPGVPDADKEKIFRRFARGSHSEHDGGSGLGLSIVSAIAETHGGSVRVEDATPHGARFVMTLPRRRRDAAWRAS